MTNEERKKYLDELMPNRKIIDIHNKFVHFRPLIFLVIGIFILISFLSNI